MVSVNIECPLSYIIPLDSIDLLYLSKYIHTPSSEKREKKLLWSNKRLDGESNYCYVQISIQDDNEGCYAEPYDTYLCQVCNEHVPTICYKEHTESEQHETFKNIYQKVLERVSKQINISYLNNDNDVDKDVYYCVPCSKIIKIKNKHKHELSTYHVKSIKKKSIISQFHEILKDNESCDGKNVVIEEIDDFEYFLANNNYDATNNSFCHNLDNDKDSIDLSTITDNVMMTIAPPTVSGTSNNIQPTNDKKTEKFEDYLKQMIKKYNIKVNVPVMDGLDISLVAPNGNTVKVSTKHFQSYRQLNDMVFCQMCKIWISQNTKPHDVTENHVRNILKPINENFARTIDTVSCHCVVCNVVVMTDFNHHTIDEDHLKIIKDTHTAKRGKTYCEDCKVYIDTHNFAAHLKANKHLNVLMQLNSIQRTVNNNFYDCKICKVTVAKNDFKNHIISKTHTKKKNDSFQINNNNNDSTQTNKNSNDSTQSNNNSRATETNKKNKDSTQPNNNNKDSIQPNNSNKDSTQPNNENKDSTQPNNNNKDSIQQNNNNEDSTPPNNNNKDSTPPNNENKDSNQPNNESKDSTQTNNNNKDSPAVGSEINDSGYCEVCKVSVPGGGMQIHVDGKPHKEAITKFCTEHKNGIKPKENKVQISAKSNSVTKKGSSENKAKNNNSRSSRKSRHKKKFLHSDVLDYSEYTNAVRCKICSEYIVLIDKYIKEHIKCKSHVDRVSKKKLERYNTYLYYSDATNTKVKCEICDVQVPYTELNVIEHMAGKNHETAENELLAFHFITRNDLGSYDCNCCQGRTIDYIEHISSKIHTRTFMRKYEIDKDEMKRYVYDVDSNGPVARRHRMRYRNLMRHNMISKTKDATLNCDMCKLKLEKNTEIDHVLGASHGSKLRELCNIPSPAR